MHLTDYFYCASHNRLYYITPFFGIGVVLSLLNISHSTVNFFVFFILFIITIFLAKRIYQFFLFWILIGVSVGGIYGAIYSHYKTEHRPLTKIIKSTSISGTILKIVDTNDKPRIILKPDHHDEINIEQNIRLNISDDDYKILLPNDYVTTKVFLAPPPKPLFDGAYDFEAYALRNGIGAIGRLSEVMSIKGSDKTSLSVYIHQLRVKIHDIINAELDNKTQSSPIIAMLTGARFEIPENVSQSWKVSGIYHLLSISGLHMTIVASLLFFTLRRLLLFIPYFAHGGLTKKIAAICVIPMGYCYVLLSGGAVPVTRAYIMVCVGLIAILRDQNILTLRSLCIAFCLVILVNPVDIFNIGFILSFSAVLGIIIAVNIVNRLKKNYSINKVIQFILISSGAGYVGVPIAIYTFGYSSLYSLLANMVAIPIASFFLMPLLVLSVFMMPVGLSDIPLQLAGFIIDILNQLAFLISDLPHALIYLQPPSIVSLVIFYIGIYLLSLDQVKTYVWGIALILISFTGYIFTPPMNDLILKNKTAYYIRDKDHSLIKLSRFEISYHSDYDQNQILQYFGLPMNTRIYGIRCYELRRNTLYQDYHEQMNKFCFSQRKPKRQKPQDLLR